jgi:Zn-dependent membrane protease YugP
LEDYHENATLASYSHLSLLIFGMSGLILRNNGIQILGGILISLALIALIFFLVLLPKVLKNQSEFYKLLKRNLLHTM